MKKITIYSELVYVMAMLIITLSVAMCTAADFGVSMIVAPAYILHLKFSFLTFGQAEYIVQGLLFVLFCIIMKSFRFTYFGSFITALIYGAVLDLWCMIIPALNPSVTPAGSMPMAVRVALFAASMVLTSFSVSLFFRTYLHPEVYDMFVSAIADRYNLNTSKFKYIFDFTCLAVSIVMTLVFFRRIEGIGIGTVVICVVNGFLIGMFGKIMDKYVTIKPLFPKFKEFCRY